MGMGSIVGKYSLHASEVGKMWEGLLALMLISLNARAKIQIDCEDSFEHPKVSLHPEKAVRLQVTGQAYP